MRNDCGKRERQRQIKAAQLWGCVFRRGSPVQVGNPPHNGPPGSACNKHGAPHLLEAPLPRSGATVRQSSKRAALFRSMPYSSPTQLGSLQRLRIIVEGCVRYTPRAIRPLALAPVADEIAPHVQWHRQANPTVVPSAELQPSSSWSRRPRTRAGSLCPASSRRRRRETEREACSPAAAAGGSRRQPQKRALATVAPIAAADAEDMRRWRRTRRQSPNRRRTAAGPAIAAGRPRTLLRPGGGRNGGDTEACGASAQLTQR